MRRTDRKENAMFAWMASMKWVWFSLTVGALGMAFTSLWKYIVPVLNEMRKRIEAGRNFEDVVNKGYVEYAHKAMQDQWVTWSSNAAAIFFLLFVLSLISGWLS